MDSVCLHLVILWIYFHLRHSIVELHVFLADPPTVLHGLDSFLKIVRCSYSGIDACFTDEGDRCTWNQRSKHGPHDDRLDGGN